MPENKTLKEEADAQRAALVKRAEDLKNATRRLFTTKDGITVANAMMSVCEIYNLDIDSLKDPELRSAVGKTFLYKAFIIGMLTPQQRMAIETPDKKEK